MNNEKRGTHHLFSLIHSLERTRLTFPIAILTFCSIVFARAFLEGIFERSHTIGLHPVTEISIYNVFLHFPVYYLFVLMASMLLLHFITRESIEKVGKLVLFFLPVTLIPPLIDLFITPGRGDALFYFMEIKDIGRALFGTFMPPMTLNGVSFGIRIEVFIGCLLAALYGGAKTRKWYLGAAAFIGTYLILILSGAIPVLSARALSLFHPLTTTPYETMFRSGGLIATETQRVTLVAIIPLLFLIPLVLYRWSPKTFKNTFRISSPYLTIHFTGMILAGFVLAYMMKGNTGIPLITNTLDYVALLILLIAGYCAFQAMVLFDHAIDGSEKERTPISAGALLFLSSLIICLSISYTAFFLVMVFGLVFFFSLSPPFRLKRFFPFSTLSLSCASLVVALLGFSLFTGEKAAFIFPPRVAWSIILLFTFTFSLRDLATLARDKALHYRTIPTTLGESRGRWVTAILVSLAFLAVPLILRAYLLFIPAVFIAAIITLLIFRRSFRHRFEIICAVILPLSVIILFLTHAACCAGHGASLFLAYRYYSNARTFDEKGATDKALAGYEAALNNGYESVNLYRNAGMLYLKTGEVHKAIEILQTARALQPDEQDAWILLVQAFTRAGEYSRAIAECDKGISGGKYRAEFLMLKGQVLLSQGNASPALNAFKQAIRFGEHSGNSLMAIASIYLSMDSLDSAIDTYTEALKFLDERHVLKARAEAYYRKGASNSALSDLLAAEQHDPHDAEIKNNIGILHYQQGDYHAAERYLTEAISLDRDYLVAYQNLRDTYVKMGKKKEVYFIELKINELCAREHING